MNYVRSGFASPSPAPSPSPLGSPSMSMRRCSSVFCSSHSISMCRKITSWSPGQRASASCSPPSCRIAPLHMVSRSQSVAPPPTGGSVGLPGDDVDAAEAVDDAPPSWRGSRRRRPRPRTRRSAPARPAAAHAPSRRGRRRTSARRGRLRVIFSTSLLPPPPAIRRAANSISLAACRGPRAPA